MQKVLSTLVLLFILSPLAHSEHMAIEGQYVIRIKKDDKQVKNLSRSLEKMAVESKKIDSFNSQLLTKRESVGEAKIKALNLVDDFCEELKDELANSEGIAREDVLCSPNIQYRISATPNDEFYNRLWGMSATAGIDAPSAWDVTTDAKDVVVAVIDTGVDYSHPDLAPNMWVNSGEIPGNGIDDDRNGYIDDVHGISPNSGNPMDDNGHGTHVAGTIGAAGNNSYGVSGVAWNVKIMGLKFLGATGGGNLADAVKMIDYMIMMKNRGVNLRVSNNSWGGGGHSDVLESAIKDARDAGIIFVAAAGNSSVDNDSVPEYPATYSVDNVVSVAAIDSDGNLASFSNYGYRTVDIAAPGHEIFSTIPGNRFTSLSGTSMASPHVAGALALLIGHEPDLSYDQAIKRLYDTGVDSNSLTGLIGTGRKLNLNRLIRNIGTPAIPPTKPPFCSYRVEEIGYNPDRSADNAEIVQKADEYNFVTATLPFRIPFYGENRFSVKLSPNGVMYLAGAPTNLDYKNSKIAPLNSIAPLHADLNSTGPSEGLRVSISEEKATFFWKAHFYRSIEQGSLEVRTSIYPDGTIESFYSIPNATLLKKIRKAATIGVTGSVDSHAKTYAFNSTKIDHLLGVRFVPDCSGNDTGSIGVPIKSLKVRINKKSQVNSSSNKRPMKLTINALEEGNAKVNIKINKFICEETLDLYVHEGRNRFASSLPKMVDKFRSVSFSSGSKTRKLKINSNLDKQNTVNKRNAQKKCKRFIKKLRFR